MAIEIKKLNTLIGVIGKNASKLREDIQTALIGCAYHAQLHRNTDPFNRLFEAVGTGTRLEGMLKWATLYAPVYFRDGKVLVSDKRQKEIANTLSGDEFEATLLDSEKWYAIAKPEPVKNPWDASKFAEALALYLENAAKKAEKAGDASMAKIVKDAEMLFRVELNKVYDAPKALNWEVNA